MQNFFLFALPITFVYRAMVVQVGVGPVTVGVVQAEILTVPILVEVVLAEGCLRQYL